MHEKIWKQCTSFFLIAIITIFIVLFLTQIEALETALSYMQFSEETKEGRYKITDEADYLEFARTVANGNTYAGCEIILKSDLDFSDYENIPVIGMSDGQETIGFKGFFNGNGHVISGINIVSINDVSGMFACLEGIVANLNLKNCVFQGEISGGIAVQAMKYSQIVNCYVDVCAEGEIRGCIAGEFSGEMFNCISTDEIIGVKTETAYLDNCYLEVDHKYASFTEELGVLDGITVRNYLNDNLPKVSGWCEVYDLCYWNVADQMLLSYEKADLLKNLTAKMYIDKKEIELIGYYSKNTGCWSITVPAGHLQDEITMVANTSNGKRQVFQKSHSEEQVLFSWKEYKYLIDYLCADNIDTLYFTLTNNKNLDYVHKNKREEIPGMVTVFESNGTVSYEVVDGFYGHGNDSWTFEKKSYNLKLENRTDLLGLGENEDFALLAGYRQNSLMSFCTMTEIVQELGVAYAPEFRLVNVFVEGEYAGVYFLTEKIEIDENCLDLLNLYEETKNNNHGNLTTFQFYNWKDTETKAERYWYDIPQIPDDITGAYILEADSTDYTERQSRFVSERNIHLTLKRFNYASKEEVNYIADYWQDFEDALFSKSGYNKKGKYYTEYIDLESFATQWLLYELAEEASLGSSIYFYKEPKTTGDGKLHACYPWDMEQSYIQERQDILWNVKVKGKAMYGYWGTCYTHEDFRNEVRRIWKEKLVPILVFMLQEDASESKNGAKNLSLYINEMEQINKLETARWNEVNPLKKCTEIKTFLSTRMDVLNELLYNEEILEEYFEDFYELF